jgi:tetratricopeptide (TPR) repeat protein
LSHDSASRRKGADLERALDLDPGSWRVRHALVEYHTASGNVETAWEHARFSWSKYPDNPVSTMDAAKTLLRLERFQECLDLLEKAVILPYEGAREGHDIYRYAHLMRSVEGYNKAEFDLALERVAAARRWPERLGVGRPYITDERLEDYVEAVCLDSQGRTGEARQKFQDIVDRSGRRKDKKDPVDYLAAVALEKMGRREDAGKFLNGWTSSIRNKSLSTWALARFQGNRVAAAACLPDLLKNKYKLPWELSKGDQDLVWLIRVLDALEN